MTITTTLPNTDELYKKVVKLVSEYDSVTGIDDEPTDINVHMFQQPSNPNDITSTPQWVTVFGMIFDIKKPEDGISDLSIVFFDEKPVYMAEYNCNFHNDVEKCRIAPIEEAKERYADSAKVTIL